jgi:hypothetical protein
MGMDVIGKNAVSETGEYFRRNVWGWRPLWQYVEIMHKDLAEKVEYGQSNDGDGLNAEDSKDLAQRLLEDVKTKKAEEYISQRNIWLSTLPRESCQICNNTGIRSDEIGLEHGMPEKELTPEVQVLTGRTHGYCNGCSGVGSKENWELS